MNKTNEKIVARSGQVNELTEITNSGKNLARIFSKNLIVRVVEIDSACGNRFSAIKNLET